MKLMLRDRGWIEGGHNTISDGHYAHATGYSASRADCEGMALKNQKTAAATLLKEQQQQREKLKTHKALRVLSEHQSKLTTDHNQLKSLPADGLNALLRRMQLELDSDPDPCNNSHEMKGEIEIEPTIKICRDSTVKEGTCNVISFSCCSNMWNRSGRTQTIRLCRLSSVLKASRCGSVRER